jgi:hypothetical protein
MVTAMRNSSVRRIPLGVAPNASLIPSSRVLDRIIRLATVKIPSDATTMPTTAKQPSSVRTMRRSCCAARTISSSL